MINKKNVLGKTPDEAGIKDAVHVAIVSVRAGCCIKPGSRIKLNDSNEAIPDQRNGIMIADPFGKHEKNFTTGEFFWALMDQAEIPNVRHVWDHPSVSDFVPIRPVVQNKYIKECAAKLQISYEQLMTDLAAMVSEEDPVYSGPLTEEQIKELIDCRNGFWACDIFNEWAEEVGHEFANDGSECCPEYDYPEFQYQFKQVEPIDSPSILSPVV